MSVNYREPIGPATDLTKWRLHCKKGRQTWEYDEENKFGRGPSFIEKNALGLDTVSDKHSLYFYSKQTPDNRVLI